jgi:hypothetical protein
MNPVLYVHCQTLSAGCNTLVGDANELNAGANGGLDALEKQVERRSAAHVGDFQASRFNAGLHTSQAADFFRLFGWSCQRSLSEGKQAESQLENQDPTMPSLPPRIWLRTEHLWAEYADRKLDANECDG